MRVPLEIPDTVWGRLADIADGRGVKVTQVVNEALTAVASPRGYLADRIILAVLNGQCDADIAAELGLTNRQVQDVRLGAHMKANKRPARWARKATNG